MSSKIRRVNV